MIDRWLELVRDARHLKPEKYRDWCFIVGSSGSLEERIELGEKALEMLKPKSGEVVTFNLSHTRVTFPDKGKDENQGEVTDAVSPTSGDYPMQRGVKRG